MGVLSARRIGCYPGWNKTQVSRSTRVLRHNRNHARHHHWRDSVRERTRGAPKEVAPRLSKRRNKQQRRHRFHFLNSSSYSFFCSKQDFVVRFVMIKTCFRPKKKAF
uniref:Uncharacterized protein n=1 Tax=Brassica oleracea var. oleracea TaxID=109376 RepID=A0A0D3CC96_BRAOL